MQFGIKHRVLLLALVPTITISVLLVTYFVNTRLQDLEEAFRAHGEKIALQLEKELNNTYSDLSQIENLSGWLKLELETTSIKLREYQILAKAILIFLFGLSISALIAYRMGRNLTHPIFEIGEVVNKIRQGALNTRTQVSSYPELKMLGSGINAMAETLENAHNELQYKINQATLSLRRTLETIEVQNIELEMSRRAAEHANKIKSEFLADMSHEIRTPLNAVVGFINLLQKTELNQKQQEYILTIQKSANNLLIILNDMLDFSKIEAGKFGEIELKNILEKWIKPETNACTIDWALGTKLVGGRLELAQELFEKLKEILPLEKRRINEDYQNKSWQALDDRVHKLHGLCCYCGVPKLKNCIQILETAVASCVSDIIKPHLEAFNLAVDAVLTDAENTTVNDI